MSELHSRLACSCTLLCLIVCSCSFRSDDSSRGLILHRAGAADGYVLFAPLLSSTTYLVDSRGSVVHTWKSSLPSVISTYLLRNGHLLRTVQSSNPAPFSGGGGYGGLIQKLGWNGELLWNYALPGEMLQHHDLEPLPNGNLLAIAWELKTRAEALAAGRHPNRVGSRGLWADCVLEIRPIPPEGGEIVWRWCMWDHLIQDIDVELPGHGDVSKSPERIDINGDRYPQRLTEELLRRLKALGYVAEDATPRSLEADFLHTNSVAYHPELDQILLSVPRFNEIWVIDHSTTSDESSAHVGGKFGRGGNLLYRWGNPIAYNRGGLTDKHLYSQHDARWVPAGMPGAGHITVFNNGLRLSLHAFSSVLEIEAPLGPSRAYTVEPEGPFGPEKPVWLYTASPKNRFFAEHISGAHRVANGNTFITDGPRGRLFQVTPRGKVVWQYDNPYSGDAPNPHGDPPYSVFRATFLPADHPPFVGRDLVPLVPQPPFAAP